MSTIKKTNLHPDVDKNNIIINQEVDNDNPGSSKHHIVKYEAVTAKIGHVDDDMDSSKYENAVSDVFLEDKKSLLSGALDNKFFDDGNQSEYSETSIKQEHIEVEIDPSLLPPPEDTDMDLFDSSTVFYEAGYNYTANYSENNASNTLGQQKRKKSSPRSKNLHLSEKSYKCSMCDYMTAFHANLSRHMRYHTGMKPFQCSLCNYKTADISHLKGHMVVHTGEKPYECSVCGFKTARKDALRKHKKLHTGEKPYECSACDFKTSDKGHLRKHVKSHTAEKIHQCSVCGYDTFLIETLNRHMRLHTGEKPYKCVVCEYRTTHKGDLTRHIRIHTGEKPYKCSYCEYRATVNSAVIAHMKLHTGASKDTAINMGRKAYKCSICEYTANRNREVILHTRKIHADVKPLVNQKYVCTKCEFKSSIKKNLIRHMTKHNIYECTVCEFQTVRPRSLRAHMKQHAGEDNQNSSCEYKTTDIVNLSTHTTKKKKEVKKPRTKPNSHTALNLNLQSATKNDP